MEKKQLFELTNPQKSIWLTEQYYKGSTIGNLVGTLTIDEKVDFELLKKSINIFIQNNDGIRLRLLLKNDSVLQYVNCFVDEDFEIIELEDEKQLNHLETKVTNSCFDLIDNNLFSFTIFKFPNGHGGFIAKLHHIICDAWTMTVLTNQIITNYDNLLNNKPVDNTSYSYIDFINSEKEYLNSSKFLKSKEFWDSKFDSLSFSYICDTNSNSCLAKRKSYCLSKNFCNSLSNFFAEYKTSAYSIFMSALSIYLSKINNVSNPIVGTPVLNRCNFSQKNTIGMFISTVPFKTHIDLNNTYISLLKDFSNTEFSIFRNQRYPFNILLNDLRKKFNFSKNLYDVALSYQNARNNNSTSNIKYHTNWIFNNTVANNLDIHIHDMDDTGLLSIYYDYKLDLFHEKDIILLHKRLMHIINQVINNPYILLKNIDILSPDEKDFILNKYNNTKLDIINIPVIRDFENQVKLNPNNIAICDKEKSYTYKELNCMANNLSFILSKKNIKPYDKICLFLENSIELIVSILATLKLEACYIPIDVKYPIDRVKYIIQNSNAKIVLSNNKNKKSISQIKDSKYIIDLEILDTNFSKAFNTSKIKDDSLAYIIYTSGSTGNPKGVSICNKSLSNYISFCKRQYVSGKNTNFPLYSSIAFDLTVTSIYTPLTTGNTIYIYENENPQLLLKSIIEDRKVHIIKLTPAHLNLLLDIDCSESIVNKLIVGGDLLSIESCEKISSKFINDLHIYNEYGPTEATVGCMIHEYSKKDKKYTSIPIGKPIDNVNIYILDNNLSLVPCGMLGQMYIGGDCLSSGYINLENANKCSFIISPFDNTKILYKTGDLAKLYYNGTMEYFGRSDFQVKINGFRIEIGEIQSNLLKHNKIKDCYITTINIDNQKILCAYYTSICDKDLDNLDLFLSKSLPLYMIPKYFIRLENIPLSVNGKVDKKLLPIPEIKQAPYTPPENNLEELLQNIFYELLNVEDKISVTANIFEYYIDSLILIKAQTMLYTNGIDVNTQVFYEYKTIRELANYILDHTNSDYYNKNTYPDISQISKPINKKFNYNNILLFGSTGFLGIHILHNLLVLTTSQIYCIIREKSNISSYERLNSKFKLYFSEDEFLKYKNRINIIEGNILQDNLGLSSQTYDKISNNIDCVIDTAAIVKHYGSYDEFFKTNVKGTKQVVTFCKKNNIPLHYVSTLSVSGYGLVETPNNSKFDESNLYIGQKYKDNVYVRSKFEAEKLIINECKNGLVASIYRIGNITNRFTDGMFQENAKENAFLNRLTSFICLGCVPKELLNFNFEFTPVDICANFIVNLINLQNKNLEIYHLFNSNYLNGKTLVKFITDTGYNIKSVDMCEFKDKLMSSNKLYFGITSYLNNLNNNGNVELNNTITNKLLLKNNLIWPQITNEYIEKLIKYLEKNNFIGGNNNETNKKNI